MHLGDCPAELLDQITLNPDAAGLGNPGEPCGGVGRCCPKICRHLPKTEPPVAAICENITASLLTARSESEDQSTGDPGCGRRPWSRNTAGQRLPGVRICDAGRLVGQGDDNCR